MKQLYIEKLTKICLGDFLGDFSLSLGDFLTKTSGHPGYSIGPILLLYAPALMEDKV
jgi:hypothetical protein